MSTDFSSLVPLEGGWSGQTFLAQAGGQRSVVRIYAEPGHRGAAAAEVDAALLRLVRGLVPVPEVLEVRRPAGDLPALLVTSFLPGARADLLLPELDDRDRALLGSRLGGILADLAGMPWLRAGPFLDADLVVGSFGRDLDGLPAVVDQATPHLGWWSPREIDGLRGLAVDAQALLDTVDRVCLVHSDFNAKNLLVDAGTLEVTGVLDWEFAHAGHPFTDLGNLLRLERDPAFAGAVLDAWVGRRGGSAASALELARAADLVALVDLAGRRGQNPVADLADAQLRAVARSGDLHARP